jgi:hypothetical protein
LSEQNEVRTEIVLPSSLVLRIERLINSGSQSGTVSQYVEKVVRASVASEESRFTHEHLDPETEAIRARLKELGYL